MVNNQSNCNGKDDDNIPSNQGIYSRGGIRKDRPSEQEVSSSSFNVHEAICELEEDAYHALLRAFIGQSEHFMRSKKGLMSTLREELRITDDQHLQMLGTVEHDETLARILTWRYTKKDPSMPPPPPPPQESSLGLAYFQSRKKQKISHVSRLAPLLKPIPCGKIVTSISNGRGLPTQKTNAKKNIEGALESNVLNKGTPRPNVGKHGKVGGGSREPIPGSHVKGTSPSIEESWVGRSLYIRWSKDNILYKALIVDYDKEHTKHRVAYDIGTPNETFEWINLTKMGDNDIQWLDKTDDAASRDGKVHLLGFSIEQGKEGLRLPMKKSKGRDVGRSLLESRLWKKEAPVEVDNCGTNEKGPTTEVKFPEVAKFVKEINALEHENDLEKLENGKRIKKEYEEMLLKALAMVTNFSIDGESNEDDASSDNGDSSTDDDFSEDEGSKVNYSSTSITKSNLVEDNGDNDDYIEID